MIRSRHFWLLLAGLLVLHSLPTVTGGVETRIRKPPTETFNCGTRAKIVEVDCLLDSQGDLQNFTYVLSDGTAERVCFDADTPTPIKRRMVLPPDDGIYALRICYEISLIQGVRTHLLVGIRFSAISQVLACGVVRDNPAPDRGYCYDVQAPGAAPLGAIGPPNVDGQDNPICAGSGPVFYIQNVCWNRYYVSPYYPPGGCPAGQGIVTPGLPCQNCDYGFFNPGGLVFCARCANGTTTTYLGSTSCGCRPGTGWTGRSCVACAPGFYSPGGSKLRCYKCPGLFMTSPAGASDIRHCTCQAGYGVTVDFPTTCSICPVGTFSTGTVSASTPASGRRSNQAQLVAAAHPGAGAASAAEQQAGAAKSVPTHAGPSTAAAAAGGGNPLIPISSLNAPAPSAAMVNAAIQAAVGPSSKGKGKGKGRPCLTCSPSYQQCTDCCDTSELNTCTKTTAQPGSTSFSQCV